DAFLAATRDVATSALGFDGVRVIGRRPTMSRSLQGAYIALVSDRAALQFGIVSDEPGCAALGRALLGMTPADPRLGRAEIVDGLGEIVNIVAGATKNRLVARDASIRIGLPIFINGYVGASPHLETEVAAASIGPVSVELLAIR